MHTLLQEFSLPLLCHQTLLEQEYHLHPEDTECEELIKNAITAYEKNLKQFLSTSMGKDKPKEQSKYKPSTTSKQPYKNRDSGSMKTLFYQLANEVECKNKR